MLSSLIANNYLIHGSAGFIPAASGGFIKTFAGLANVFSLRVKPASPDVAPPKAGPSDDDCMKQISKGQEDAFKILFQRYGRLVLGYSQKLLADRNLAEDVSQEVWVKVIHAAASYRAENKCRAWILQITRNACFTSLRAQNKLTLTEDEHLDVHDESQESALTVLESSQNAQKLKRALEELPQNQRLALLMWMTEEQSYEDIARELNTSVASVKSLIFRARQSLQQSLGGAL